MSTRNYTKDDLQILDELSDQSFLCFSVEKTWRLVWKSHKLTQEYEKEKINSDYIDKMKQIYQNKESYLHLQDKKRGEIWFRVSYEKITFEQMPCLLYRLTQINDVTKAREINRSRVNNVPCRTGTAALCI